MLSRFKSDLEDAKRRVQQSGIKVMSTARGPIAYLEFGEGTPVLLIHGVVEGADHGTYLADAYLGEGFRVIAISRFGYAGSPVPDDSSPAAQADLFTALLDAKGIEQVAVVATSAGTASAFRFGMQHPDRCRAVVIWSQAVPPYSVPPALMTSMLRAFFGSSFAFWFLMHYIPPLRDRLIGIPRGTPGPVKVAHQELIEELVASFLPMSLRADGVLNDIHVTNPDLNALTLEGLGVPALIIHAKDDPWGSHQRARRLASTAPNARFVEFEDGGHLLLGHVEEARNLIINFIREQSQTVVGDG